LGALYVIDGGQFEVQHVAVEEQEGAEGDVLRGGGYLAVDSQVGQVGGDLFRPHVFGVGPPAVELDEAADGEQVGFLGPVAQMLEPHDLAAFLEEVLNRHGAASGQDPG
jgi:hypothetical protein